MGVRQSAVCLVFFIAPCLARGNGKKGSSLGVSFLGLIEQSGFFFFTEHLSLFSLIASCVWLGVA